MKRLLLAFSVALAAAPVPRAAAQQATYPQRTYTTQRAEPDAPRIDGRVDDTCWNAVEWSTDFTQWEPAEGKPPTYQTAFKILYDEHNLYIAYRAYDAEPDKITKQLARRDNFPGDWVEINIDSYFDHRTAFSFTSSVSEVRGDEFVSQDGDNWDGNWDPIWELHTQVDAEGWTAELRIPLSQLRFSEHDEQVWGIQVQRRLYRKEERSLWQPKAKTEAGWVSRFGELRGIRGIHAQRQVELLPYTVGKGENFEAVEGNPFMDGTSSDLQAGLDGKVGVASNLTMDFTVNPDFGQVEADPSEVNLTAFETRFSEKRPFFIEGNSILDFQLSPAITGGSFTDDNLFYSRRIGRSPRTSPDLADNEYADVPGATSIIAAAKLTGRNSGGLSTGVLESVTAREQAQIRSDVGKSRDETVEPLTNFFVGRVTQDLRGGNSHLGGMLTAVNRRIDSPGIDFLHRAAYTGGLDFLHQWHDRKWYVAGTGSASRVEGSAEALVTTQTSSARYFQRPDNDYVTLDSTRTSLDGYASSMRFGRSGGHWRFETGAAMRSPGFEINDAGFMQRADEVNQFTWVGWSHPNPFAIFRRLQINGNQWLNWDFGGTLLTRQVNSNFNANFKNNWACGAGVTRTFERISNYQLRGGPSSLWPEQWDAQFWVDTDYRRKFAASFGASFTERDENSLDHRNVWVDLTYRPSNALRFVVSPSYTYHDDDLQFVDIQSFGQESRYLFGHLMQETGAVTLRLDYTIRPNLTLQFYGAPFVSAGAYDAFKRITSPRAEQFEDRSHTFGDGEIAYDAVDGAYRVDEDVDGTVDYSFDNPDFNFRDFNSNLVARWEFSPGSTAYLVWSQARSDFAPNGHFDYGNDMHGLFDVQAHNVFLLKVSKWFSL